MAVILSIAKDLHLLVFKEILQISGKISRNDKALKITTTSGKVSGVQ